MPSADETVYAASVHMVTDRRDEDGEPLCVWVHGWVWGGVAVAEEWDEPITTNELARAEAAMIWSREREACAALRETLK